MSTPNPMHSDQVAVGAWTKGPWDYRPQELDDWGIVRAAPDEQGRRRVVCQAALPHFSQEVFDEHRRNGTDPREANARLIAAAPELYSALSDLMENPQFVVSIGGNPNMVDALMDRSLAALAKARVRLVPTPV